MSASSEMNDQWSSGLGGIDDGSGIASRNSPVDYYQLSYMICVTWLQVCYLLYNFKDISMFGTTEALIDMYILVGV